MTGRTSHSIRDSSRKQQLGGDSFDPDLRIPPLQNPVPLVSARRPPPLEPSARVDDGSSRDDPRAKLATRTKSAKEALTISLDTDAPYDQLSVDVDRSTEHTQSSRKKAKVDIFHLPKPNTDQTSNRPPPFKHLPILNGLHEPPPSAGLFPPITPSTLQDGAANEESLSDSHPDTSAGKQQARSASNASSNEPNPEFMPKQKAKRQCLRGRLRWTPNETRDLLQGVQMYGVGKWKKILTHAEFNFHPDRTMVDLKDRYRTCRMNEERALERHAIDRTLSTDVGSPTRIWTRHPLSSGGSKPSTPPNGVNPSEPVFDVTTPSEFKESLESPKVKKSAIAHPWTVEEDARLSRGYSKYGFQWTAIAKDADLDLSHRTGAQVRDRFRMKWPEIYASAPIPQPPKNADSKARRNPALFNGKEPIMRSKLTFIMHDGAKGSGSKRRSVPKLQTLAPHPSSSKDTSPITPGGILPDRFSGLNMAPLPEPELDAGASSGPEMDADNNSSQSVADPEEVRHLSILGLLNEDDEQRFRLPPFRYAYDVDWDAGTGSTGLTLPPLVSWDDVARKDVFDLD